MGKRTKSVQEMSLSEYKANKIQILERDFLLKLKPDEKMHLLSLDNDIQVDQYAISLLNKSW